MARFVFIRHARHQADPTQHPIHWSLNALGLEQAGRLAAVPELLRADVLVASEELKACMTLEPLAHALCKGIMQDEAFNEVWREEKFLSDAAFAEEKRRQLEDLEYHAFGGESGHDALKRFKAGVAKFETLHKGKTIVVASHGTILSIYFADLLQKYDRLTERWKKTDFSAYGIIENGKLVQDIVSE